MLTYNTRQRLFSVILCITPILFPMRFVAADIPFEPTPAKVVSVPQGYIRFWWQGELNWGGATVDKTIETLVENLLKE